MDILICLIRLYGKYIQIPEGGLLIIATVIFEKVVKSKLPREFLPSIL